MEDGDREAVPIFPSSSLVNTMDVKIFFAHVVLQRSHTFLASGSVFDFQDVLFVLLFGRLRLSWSVCSRRQMCR